MKILTIAALVIGVAVLTGCSSDKKAEIELAIEAARDCQEESDCVRIESFCPFDCYVIVNKAEASNINQMIESYDSSCSYSCTPYNGFDCINGKCTAL